MTIDKSRIKLIVFVLFILLCAVLANLPEVRDNLSFEAVNAHLQTLEDVANSPIGPLLFILAFILIILMQMPGMIMVVVGGLVYKPLPGILLSLLGANIGTCITFLMARFFLRDFFAPKLEKSFLAKYADHLETHGIFTMIILRMIMAMAPMVSWMAGISKLSTRDYLIGNAIGLFPMIFLITFMVNRLRSISSMSDLLSLETLFLFILFMVVVTAVFILKNKLKSGNSAKRVLSTNEEDDK